MTRTQLLELSAGVLLLGGAIGGGGLLEPERAGLPA